MTRKILVTVGISLLRDHVDSKEKYAGFNTFTAPGINNVRELIRYFAEEDEESRRDQEYQFKLDRRELVEARKALVACMVRLWRDDRLNLTEHDQRKYSGAEIASLKAFHGDGTSPNALTAEDQILLLASDTPSGIFCAHILRDLLRTGAIGLPAFEQPAVEIIHGLQPYSTDQFVDRGLPTAARLVVDHSENAVLIGSGGYKGLLPYLGPLAMHLGIPVYYLYEDAAELLTLAPLPVTFDLALIRLYPSTFSKLDPVVAARQDETVRTLRLAILFWKDLKSEAGSDFAEVKEKIERYGLLQTQTLNGEEYVKLSATGVLAYILADLNNKDASVYDQSPVM